ncbi:cytochrome c family protein [Pyruvatibacter sp.]|uniref:c-type cytochrome n=1 Tax=Pyruvatibacter sp. TaxID=1981328 RepID=UPI0032F022B5
MFRITLTSTLAAAAVAVMAATLFAIPSAHAQDAPEATLIVGDPAKGKRVFNRCKACHTLDEGGPNRMGPNLYGIVGAPFGHLEGYTFSANLLELKAEGRIWDEATLDAYLKKPKDVIPKGIMSFAGLPKDSDRADVIAYMATYGAPVAEDASMPAE